MFRNLCIVTEGSMSRISAFLVITLRPLRCNKIYRPRFAKICPWDLRAVSGK